MNLQKKWGKQKGIDHKQNGQKHNFDTQVEYASLTNKRYILHLHTEWTKDLFSFLEIFELDRIGV